MLLRARRPKKVASNSRGMRAFLERDVASGPRGMPRVATLGQCERNGGPSEIKRPWGSVVRLTFTSPTVTSDHRKANQDGQ